MKSFIHIICLLVGIAVLGTVAASDVELPSDVLDCLEEIHPLYKEMMAQKAKCEEEYPVPADEDGKVPYNEERWTCIDKFRTPEVVAKLDDFDEKCGPLINSLSDSQVEKVKELINQEVFSRVKRGILTL